MVNRLRELRYGTSPPMSQRWLAEAANTSQPQIDRLEKGLRALTPRWAERLAPHLGCLPIDLLFSRDEIIAALTDGSEGLAFSPSALTSCISVRIRGAVGAGEWHDVVEHDVTEQRTTFINIGQGFAESDVFCLEVIGDSMNKIFPPGYLVHCIRYDPVRDGLPIGKYVVVVRRDQATSLSEATLKRLVERSDGCWLEPESHNDQYHAIKLEDSSEAGLRGPDSAVYIYALVIGAHWQ